MIVWEKIMSEVLLLMAMLFAAYLFMPATWFSKVDVMEKLERISALSTESTVLIPEDSVLRRHFMTQLRNEIEMNLFPRPTDSTLQRHYDAMVAMELENRLSGLEA
jgi:hypothetical protein